MSEATWKRLFRAPVVMFPTWAREKPDRLLYLSLEIGFVAKHLSTPAPQA